MPFLVLPFPAVDPVLVSIGPFAIRWYALAYIGGILLGWLYARALIRAEGLWGGKAPSLVPTTGVPVASDSVITIPKLSQREGSTVMAARP